MPAAEGGLDPISEGLTWGTEYVEDARSTDPFEAGFITFFDEDAISMAVTDELEEVVSVDRRVDTDDGPWPPRPAMESGQDRYADLDRAPPRSASTATNRSASIRSKRPWRGAIRPERVEPTGGVSASRPTSAYRRSGGFARRAGG